MGLMGLFKMQRLLSFFLNSVLPIRISAKGHLLLPIADGKHGSGHNYEQPLPFDSPFTKRPNFQNHFASIGLVKFSVRRKSNDMHKFRLIMDDKVAFNTCFRQAFCKSFAQTGPASVEYKRSSN